MTPSNYMVDKLGDVDDNVVTAGEMTLREAVRLANTDAAADTIFFSASLANSTIVMTGGAYVLSAPVTITAVSGSTQAPNLVIDGGGARSLFRVENTQSATPGIFVINSLHLRGGASSAAGTAGAVTVVGESFYFFNGSIQGSSGSSGGAINFFAGGAAAFLTVSSSTLSGNSASLGGGAVAVSGGTSFFINSTISSNTSAGAGGGVLVAGGAVVRSSNSTIAFNRANSGGAAGGGGGMSFDSASAGKSGIFNSLVIGNTSGSAAASSDIAGSVNPVSSYNLIGDAATAGGLVQGRSNNSVGNGGSGILPATRVLYPKLANNGGFVLTHALVPDSPAINAGSAANAFDGSNTALTMDTRGSGYNRLVGAPDIGAFELQANAGVTYFETGVGPTMPGASPSITATAFGNFTGETNLILANAATNTIGIFRRSPAGGYAATPAVTLTLPANADPADILVADFNDDGKPDVAVANRGLNLNDSVSVFINTTTVAGTPTFAARLDLDGPNNPVALAAVDLDGDASGNLDLIALSGALDASSNYTYSVFLGNGSGGFAAGLRFKIGDATPDASELTSPTDLAVGEFTGDALPDLVISGGNGATVAANGTSGGTLGFALRSQRLTNSAVATVLTANLAGDSRDDILIGSPTGSGQIGLLRNNGGGTFTPSSFAAFTNPSRLAVADVDADGRDDVIALNVLLAGYVSVLVNTTTDLATPTFAVPKFFHLGGSARDLASADVNGDGLVDLAIATSTGTDLLMGNAGFGANHAFVVDTLTDVDDGILTPGQRSLREAIRLANAKAGADIITFAPALTAGGIATLTLASDLPAITGDLTIDGPGPAKFFIDGANAHRIFTIDDGDNANAITVAIRDLRLQFGRANGGAAVLTRENTTFTNLHIANNVANGTSNGGAIAALGSGRTLVIDSCVFANDVASGGAGGALFVGPGQTVRVVRSTFTANSAATGGAIAVAVGGILDVASSTLNANSASSNGGAFHVAGAASLVNVTISGNAAANGGGLEVPTGGAVNLTNVTLALNTATTTQGGGGIYTAGTVRLFNTIVAGNTAAGTPGDVTGLLDGTSANNVVADAATSGGLGNAVNGNRLGVNGGGTYLVSRIINPTLALNGGLTLNHALVQNSPAIAAGSDSVTGFVRIDQREAARDVGLPDVGAFEVQHPLTPVSVPFDVARTFAPKPGPDALGAFVKGLYQSTLLREPDAEGEAIWVNELSNGKTPSQVAAGFVNSFENRSNQVKFFYRYFLGREAETEGLNYHVGRLQSGIDEGSVMSGFILSPEFAGRNDNTSFVNLMYYALLGRQADDAGFNSWKTSLDQGTLSRDQVVVSFLRSAEGTYRVIDSYYVSYVKHLPDTATRNGFTSQVLSGMTFGTVATQILGSQEFVNLASANSV